MIDTEFALRIAVNTSAGSFRRLGSFVVSVGVHFAIVALLILGNPRRSRLVKPPSSPDVMPTVITLAYPNLSPPEKAPDRTERTMMDEKPRQDPPRPPDLSDPGAGASLRSVKRFVLEAARTPPTQASALDDAGVTRPRIVPREPSLPAVTPEMRLRYRSFATNDRGTPSESAIEAGAAPVVPAAKNSSGIPILETGPRLRYRSFQEAPRAPSNRALAAPPGPSIDGPIGGSAPSSGVFASAPLLRFQGGSQGPSGPPSKDALGDTGQPAPQLRSTGNADFSGVSELSPQLRLRYRDWKESSSPVVGRGANSRRTAAGTVAPEAPKVGSGGVGQSAATAQAVLNAEKRTIVAMPRGSISGGSQGGSPGAAGDIRAGGLLTGGGGLPGSTMATRSAGAPDGIPATTGTRQAGGDGMVGGLGGVENSSPKEYLSSDIRGSASPLRGIDRSTLFRSLRSFSAAPASAFEVARGAWTGHPEKWMALTGDSLSQGRRTESWRMQIVGDPIPSQEEAGTGAFSFTSAPKSAVPPVFDSGVDVSRFQGQKVLLSAVIRKTGSVAYVQVRRGVHPAIDSSLQQALEQWDFRPPMRGDTPVPVDVLFEVAFEQEASP